MKRRKLGTIIAAAALVVGGMGALAASGATAGPAGETYTPVSPVRICDTRGGTQVAGGCSAGQVKGGSSVTVSPDAAGISGESAVVLNVTVIGGSGGGNITVDPAGVPETSTSNLNYSAGQTIPNLVIVQTGTGDKVTLYNNSGAGVQLIVDLEGYYTGPNPAPTTPTPTTSSASPTPTPTGTSTGGLPAAPAGYTDVFYDGFTKAAALGTFGTQDGGAVVYTGDHGGGWTSYPDGWNSTNSSCGYNPATVTSVDGNGLDFALHTNPAGAAYCAGKPVGANLHPDVYPTAASNPGYLTYGRVSVTLQLTGYSAAYHAVPLLWPINDSDWQSAESDFPEFDTSSGASVDAFAHYGGSGSQDDFTVPATVNGKAFSVLDQHTYTQQWTPSGTSYFVDGQLIGTSTHRTWSGPERVQLQFEPSGATGADTHVYVRNIEIDQYSGSTPTPTATTASPTPTPTGTVTAGNPAHVVVVEEENHSYSDVIGSSSAPYINALAGQGVLYTDDVGKSHPSLPNYLDLYSGSTQGQDGNDTCIQSSANNLGNELGTGNIREFAESLGTGNPGSDNGAYACRHNGPAQFTDAASKAASTDFANFPTTAAGWAALPPLSYVTPNLNDDMHDGTVAQGDSWLQAHLDGYAQWAKANNSMLVIVWDENSGSDLTTPVPMFIVGAGVTAGSTVATQVNHDNLYRTLSDWAGHTPLTTAAPLPGLPVS